MRWAVLAPFFYQPGGAEQAAALWARELDARLYVGEVTSSVLSAYPGVRSRLRPSPPFFRRTALCTAERVVRNAARRVEADALLLSGNFAFYRVLVDRRPTVAYLHAPPVDPYGVETRAARKAMVLVANAPAVADAAERVYGRRPDAVVPPPLDLAAFRATPPGERFLAGGRLVREKGFDRLVRAAAAARVPVDVYGDGPEREALAALARDLDAPVTFLGRVAESERVRLLEASRAFVFPGRDEPFGLAPAEALACGKTVLAFRDAGGPLAYLSAATSVVVEDEDALAEALRSFDDVAAARRVGACRAAAGPFDAPVVAGALRRLVEDA